ncbi:hypothetical protein ACJZ2D_004905 [Fusarium nematophilum]
MEASSSKLSYVACRQRKVKCNRILPRCGRCTNIGEECVYPTSRKSHRGKRKQVRDLEEKLVQLEDQIRTLGGGDASHQQQAPVPGISGPHESPWSSQDEPESHSTNVTYGRSQDQPQVLASQGPSLDLSNQDVDVDRIIPSDMLEDLTTIYFDNLYHPSPIIHRSRYVSSLHLTPGQQPPACLQQIIIATGASLSPQHASLGVPLYKQARASAEADEMKARPLIIIPIICLRLLTILQDQREHPIWVAHAQSWLLIANFEARNAELSRACISLGRSIRIAQVLNLHQLDRSEPSASLFPSLLPPPQDRIELEERRRTWWVVYVSDRLLFATSGLPALIDEEEMHTLLPSSEEAFQIGCQEQTSTIQGALQARATISSPLTARVLAAFLFHQASKNIPRLRACNTADEQYWTQHGEIDDHLTALTNMLPATLRLPQSSGCQHAIFINTLIYTATMCLHKTAAQKARCIHADDLALQSHALMFDAALKVLEVFRLADDLVMALKNPILDYAANICGLVFVQDFGMRETARSKKNAALVVNILSTAGQNHPVARMLAGQLLAEFEKTGNEIADDTEAGSYTGALG